MLVANSFDLWQKDTFFAAAEEVQQSADIMESAYRTWERERREGLILENSDELCRELQTALGTAKWQLEEFEKAVRLSYRNRNDDFTMARHRQFVDAIETQISRVETELRESFSKQGNQPLRWVNLNEEECNDLAAFLSGTSGISQTMKDQCTLLGASISSTFQENTCLKNKGCNQGISYHTKGSEDVLASNRDASYIIDIEATESHETRDAVNCQADRTSDLGSSWWVSEKTPNSCRFKLEFCPIQACVNANYCSDCAFGTLFNQREGCVISLEQDDRSQDVANASLDAPLCLRCIVLWGVFPINGPQLCLRARKGQLTEQNSKLLSSLAASLVLSRETKICLATTGMFMVSLRA
ncbi:hypothetical protein RHGRI_000039 [Rhododendron griersonianum]|uniref:Syntaxin 6/10/61 N-terminal domain-containing protein n=1 Tax=Rhododendron griersonianum TaxID=479676 RepID=A0AAV6LH69_9ERIC|nr:hypothetical protein RHGRI_000039 [Rhododendron griersonianum]